MDWDLTTWIKTVLAEDIADALEKLVNIRSHNLSPHLKSCRTKLIGLLPKATEIRLNSKWQNKLDEWVEEERI